MELRVKSSSGHEITTFLDNAYNQYKQSPADKQQVISKYVTAALETMGRDLDASSKDRIVPVVKDRPWLIDTKQAMLARGATNTPEHIYEDYNPQLVVLYALDSPRNIRYLTPKDLIDLGLSKESLRALACDNLRHILPKIELSGTNGLYMMTAGGDYEASLILLDSIWMNRQVSVKGDYVLAIPTRDLLLITGSDDSEGIARVRNIAHKAIAEGSYRLTEDLFVYRNGSFTKYDKSGEARSAGYVANVPPQRPGISRTRQWEFCIFSLETGRCSAASEPTA